MLKVYAQVLLMIDENTFFFFSKKCVPVHDAISENPAAELNQADKSENWVAEDFNNGFFDWKTLAVC